jgi:hypothetical protein
MASPIKDRKSAPLPAPNSSFYGLIETLTAEELTVVKQVRTFMETKIAPIITKHRDDPAKGAAPLRKALLVFVCIASSAFAQNNSDRLKGDFPFNETLQFITGSPQNGTCPHVLTEAVTQSVVTNTGVWSFDGAGNVKIVDQGVLMQVPSTDASQVTPSNSVCKGRYQLLDDDTVDLHYDCSTSPGSFFKVHTMGKITPNNILVAVHHRIDGSLEVTPFLSAATSRCACTLQKTLSLPEQRKTVSNSAMTGAVIEKH